MMNMRLRLTEPWISCHASNKASLNFLSEHTSLVTLLLPLLSDGLAINLWTFHLLD